MHPNIIAIFWQVVEAGTLLALGAILRYLRENTVTRQLEKSQDERKRELATQIGTKAVLRDKLVEAHKVYCEQGTPLTVTRHRELEEEFRAYCDLGGNGTGRHMWEEIDKLPLVAG